MFKKNHVGRPSNLELKNRKIKKIIMYGLPALVVLVGIILISNGNLRNLMGNSVTTYYCEDSSYTLNGTKCTKLIKEKAHLLGDIDGDKKINTKDLSMISSYTQTKQNFDEFQIAAMDVNGDASVDDQDIQIVKSYVQKVNLSENAGSYEIGTKLICPQDYTLEGEYCTKEVTVDAKSKTEEVKNTYTISFTTSENVSGKMENQKITSGEKINKNTFSSSKLYFKSWRVRTTKDWKYYCYIDGNKSKSEYTNVTNCEKYGYVELKDEQVIDDDILKEDLTLIAQWDKEVAISIKPVKAVTTNIQNGKKYEINNLSKGSYIPNNTAITFQINFNTHGSQKDYYYKISKANRSSNWDSGECKKITNNSITEVLEYKKDSEDLLYGNNMSYQYEQYDKYDLIKISVNIFSDSLCKSSLNFNENYGYKPQKFYIKYDLNGGSFINMNRSGFYNYIEPLKESEVHFYNQSIRLQKLFYASKIFNPTNYFLAIYKEGYDIEGFRVKNSEEKYVCYNEKGESQGFVDESECKKHGYVLYSPNSVISRTSNKPEETLTFIAQWSKSKFFVEYLPYSIQGTGSYQKLISDSNFKNTQIVTKGKKQKLNKLNIGNTAFGGWKIKSRESDKYYCYTNSNQTKKDYVDVSICNQYGYLYLSNGAEIPDEILTRGITLEPVDYRQMVTIENLKIEQATVTNPSNGKKTVEKNVDKKEVFPANTKLDFYAKVVYDTSKTYYYRVSKLVASQRETGSCIKLPKDGIIRDSLTIAVSSGRRDNSRNSYGDKDKSYQLGVSVFSDSNCSGYVSLASKYTPYYKIQTFNVKYDSNGGNEYYWPSVTKVYNYINPIDVNYSYAGTKIDYKAKSTSLHKKGYELLGFRVKNSKGKYICYNKKKESQGFVDESECKKYGYVIYRATDRLARTTSIDGETLTFIAQWIKNPITINMSKLGKTNLSKGTKVTTTVTFNINDNENVYYYKWGYFKEWYSNDKQAKQNYPNANAFLNQYDPYNKVESSQYLFMAVWKMYDPSNNTCRKITKNTKFTPTLTIEKYINAGLVMVFRDSDCQKPLDNEKDIRKFTEIYFCSNCK